MDQVSNRTGRLATFFEGGEKRMRDSGFKCRVSCLVDEPESGSGSPAFRQHSRRDRRADDVMTTLNDLGWQMLYAIKILKNMVRRQKTVIDEVMCLETRHAERRFAAHMTNPGAQRRAACLI